MFINQQIRDPVWAGQEHPLTPISAVFIWCRRLSDQWDPLAPWCPRLTPALLRPHILTGNTQSPARMSWQGPQWLEYRDFYPGH